MIVLCQTHYCFLPGRADACAAGDGLQGGDEGWIHVFWGKIRVVCGKFNQRYIMVFSCNCKDSK